MRQSEYFIPTLKELASETQIPSHQMLLRAGMVRQIGAGIFSFLPLGYKVVKKIMEILREEIDGIGGQEFLLPALNPIEIRNSPRSSVHNERFIFSGFFF